jgi:hypothetical protein
MRMQVRAASRVLAACLAVGAMTSCDSDADDADSAPSPETRTTEEIGSVQASGSNDDLDELAESASDAIDAPPLLRIRNQTSQVVVLTSADNKNTAFIKPGRSVQLMSERACGWIPLTASTEDGQLIDEYAEPCRGQTWTITDN